MFRKYAVTVFAVPCMLLAVTACVPPPTGPSVVVFPAKGKPFETFRAEDAQCRDWAGLHAGDPGQGAQTDVAAGAVIGTGVGAGLGAAIGSSSGNAGAGAAIGAASGLILGTAMGADAGRSYARAAQNRYDNAYIQCMYAYGNQVPQPQRKVVVVAPAPVPPPPVVVAPPVDVVQASSMPDVLYLDSSPIFTYSPEYGMYAAIGVPYDLMYDGRQYYYYSNGFWYTSPYYTGPWMFLSRSMYPSVFISFRIERFHEFREREYRTYRRDPGHYHGRVHHPEFRTREAVKRSEIEHREAGRHEKGTHPRGEKAEMPGRKGAPDLKPVSTGEAVAPGKPAAKTREKAQKAEKAGKAEKAQKAEKEEKAEKAEKAEKKRKD